MFASNEARPTPKRKFTPNRNAEERRETNRQHPDPPRELPANAAKIRESEQTVDRFPLVRCFRSRFSSLSLHGVC